MRVGWFAGMDEKERAAKREGGREKDREGEGGATTDLLPDKLQNAPRRPDDDVRLLVAGEKIHVLLDGDPPVEYGHAHL